MSATFKLDSRLVERSLKQFGRRLPAIAATALNRTAKGAATAWTGAVSGYMRGAIQKRAIRRQIKIFKSHKRKLTATLAVKNKAIPLIKFNARGPYPSRGKGQGVSYKIGGTRRRRRHAFIAKIKGKGKRGVFQRAGKDRLPIYELFGPSIHRVFRDTVNVVRVRAARQLPRELKGLVKKELAKAKRVA